MQVQVRRRLMTLMGWQGGREGSREGGRCCQSEEQLGSGWQEPCDVSRRRRSRRRRRRRMFPAGGEEDREISSRPGY